MVKLFGSHELISGIVDRQKLYYYYLIVSFSQVYSNYSYRQTQSLSPTRLSAYFLRHKKGEDIKNALCLNQVISDVASSSYTKSRARKSKNIRGIHRIGQEHFY